MARSLAIALVALIAVAATASSAAPLLQDALDAGWESRWTHSSDAKYTGRFKSADKGGVQVREAVEREGERESAREKSRKSIGAIDLRGGRELLMAIVLRAAKRVKLELFASFLSRYRRSKRRSRGIRGQKGSGRGPDQGKRARAGRGRSERKRGSIAIVSFSNVNAGERMSLCVAASCSALRIRFFPVGGKKEIHFLRFARRENRNSSSRVSENDRSREKMPENARAIEKKNSERCRRARNSKKTPKTKKLSLQSPDPAKHYGLTRVLAAPVKLANAENKDFVFQYDVKFTDGMTCGGEEEDEEEREKEQRENEIFFLGLKTRNFFLLLFSRARRFPPRCSSLPLSRNKTNQ